MDAFFASVEQLDNPELRGKPVAVGGSAERGVVAAASYEARKFGVRSAMSSKLAKQRCPDLIFVKPRFERYKEISHEIRKIFYSYTDLVEPLSLDEAFLDVTDNKKNMTSGTAIAREIRAKIYETTGLHASAGISINKFIAKIASDVNKPNGQKTVPPDEVLAFMSDLKIEKFFGVGKVTAKKMKLHGIHSGKELKSFSLAYLTENFGKSGQHFYNIVRGIHPSEVKPNRIRKSIAAERTFEKDLAKESYMLEKLEAIAEELERRMRKTKTQGKTITLKIKYSDFTQQTRSKTLHHFVFEKSVSFPIVKELLQQQPLEKTVRLLGISISNLDNDKKDNESEWVQLTFGF
jgi:DNA polymerase IV